MMRWQENQDGNNKEQGKWQKGEGNWLNKIREYFKSLKYRNCLQSIVWMYMYIDFIGITTQPNSFPKSKSKKIKLSGSFYERARVNTEPSNYFPC